MNALLTDHELDDVLAGAATRLTSAGAHLPLGAPPAPSVAGRGVVVTATAAALVLAAGAVLAVVGTRRHDVPAGVDPGATEIAISVVHEPGLDPPDETSTFTASPVGGTLRVVYGPNAVTLAPAAVQVMIELNPVSDTCWSPSGGNAMCSAARDVGFASFVSVREPGGQVVYTGLPEGAVLTLTSSSVSYWARAVDGVAILPYTDEVTGDASVRALAADGSVLRTDVRHEDEGAFTTTVDGDLTGIDRFGNRAWVIEAPTSVP